MEELWRNPWVFAPLLAFVLVVGVLMSRGASRPAAWRAFCAEIGGDWVEGRFWRAAVVRGHAGPWPLTLDTVEVDHWWSETTTTNMRFRARGPARDGFWFTVRRRGELSTVLGWAWFDRIKTGDVAFDGAFVVEGNDDARLHALLANEWIRRLLKSHAVDLTLNGTGELCLRAKGDADHLTRLRSLYELMTATLRSLYPAALAELTARTTEEPT